MPSRFERYRVKDGVTVLGERYFNPVWQDVDVRLAALEDIRISWEQAVKAVSDFGLLRINEVIGPAVTGAVMQVAQIDTARQAALTALDNLQSTISTVESDVAQQVAAMEAAAQSDISAWKSAQLAAIQSWKDSITTDLPTINARLDALESGGSITALTYDNRGNLRTGTPTADQMAVVQGLGLFIFYVGSDEPDDDESCFATSNGRWLLEAASWDVIDAWQSLDEEAQDVRFDDIESRWPGRVLFGTAYSPITSLAGNGTQASFTGTVAGAAAGDVVVANPPDALTGNITTVARVTAPNTVTVYLGNPSYTNTAVLNPGTWQLAVFKKT